MSSSQGGHRSSVAILAVFLCISFLGGVSTQLQSGERSHEGGQHDMTEEKEDHMPRGLLCDQGNSCQFTKGRRLSCNAHTGHRASAIRLNVFFFLLTHLSSCALARLLETQANFHSCRAEAWIDNDFRCGMENFECWACLATRAHPRGILPDR